MFHWTEWFECCSRLSGKGCFTGLDGMNVVVD